jgi:hypothetical protein
MPSTSYQILKGASVLIFVIAIFLFVSSQIITFASRRVPIRNNDRQIIGETSIPHDYGFDFKIYGVFVVISGLQSWAIFALGKGQR